MSVRVLRPEDAAELRALRLRALREAPDAFISTIEEAEELTEAWFAERLAEPLDREAVFGAFEPGGAMIGLTGIYRETRIRIRHRLALRSMFVAPEARGQRHARNLLEAAIDHARRMPGVEQIHLSVITDNPRARALYLRAGFVVTGTLPHAMKTDARYLDEELLVLFLDGRAPRDGVTT
jgi:RimJ/RimL family protein N-acetyltransferase